MPEPTFGPDKCQEDNCLNPQVQAFVHRGICPLQAFVLRGICPTGGQMPVQAFVLPGICLSRHLSANRTIIVSNLTVIKVTLRMMIVIGGADTLLTMLSHGGHLLTRRPPDSSTQRK